MCHAVNNPGLGTMNSKHLKRKKENSFLFRLNFFLTRVCVCVKVAESCLTLWLHGLYLPGSSVDGILQARILEWVAVSFYPSSIFSVSSNAKGHPPPTPPQHTHLIPSLHIFFSVSRACLSFDLLWGETQLRESVLPEGQRYIFISRCQPGENHST